MPRNGAGSYIPPANSVDPAVPNTVISSTDFNALIADMVVALSSSLASDGQTVATQRIPFAQGASVAAGTVTVPGLSIVGDANTGIFAPAADQLAITAGGVQVLLATATGITAIVSTAVALQTPRTISITGDGAYTSTGFDGTGNVTGVLTLLTVNANTGTFGSSTLIPQITVDEKGRVTAVANILAAGGGGGGAVFDANSMLFGDGADGNVTVSGAVTLTKDMFYNNLTIAAGAALNAAGFRIHVKGTLDLTAAPAGGIFCNGGAGGNAASAASGGTAGAAAYVASASSIIPQNLSAPAGSAGQTGAGTAGTADVGALTANGGTCGRSGAGGAGTQAAGAAGGAQTAPTAYGINITWGPLQPLSLQNNAYQFSNAIRNAIAGQSGGSGGGDTVNRGGACGGGGGSGGVVLIYANTISRGAGTVASCIQAKGGAAGAGFAPAAGNAGGGGGSSGGGGGWVILVVRTLSGTAAPNAIDVTGGNGGDGTNGFGTGIGADGGGSGQGGRVHLVYLDGGTETLTLPVASVAGTAHSGITGGAKGTATLSRVAI